jgi:hypothetical protein
MRVALYWAPAVHDPLWRAGCTWLGRDAETGAAIPQPGLPRLPTLTADARRYGFHATLRPPMRLATGWDEFRAAARQVANATKPFALPALQVAEIGGFLALRESSPCGALRDLADRCVEMTDIHRLPPGAEELAKRRAAGLAPRQEAMLQRWGYPYVMDEWFFHITLTRRLEAHERAAVRASAAAHFAGVLHLPRMVEELCIFTQRNADFLIAERIMLG